MAYKPSATTPMPVRRRIPKRLQTEEEMMRILEVYSEYKRIQFCIIGAILSLIGALLVPFVIR